MKRNLAKILSDLDAVRRQASIDLGQVSVKFKSAQAIVKADAEARLPLIEAEYRDQVKTQVATIFVTGSQENQQAFATLAEAEGETLTVDADEIYKAMAFDVEPSIGAKRQFGGTQLNLLIRALEDAGRKAGVGFLPVPRLLDVETVRTPADTVALIKNMIGSQVAGDLHVRFLETRILEEALAKKYGEKIVPVVITGADPAEVVGLQERVFAEPPTQRREGLPGVGIVFDVGATVNKDSVLEAFTKLRERIAKQK